MDEKMKKNLEKFDADYCKIASKDAWEPKDIEMMKDLQKLMYYIEVRDAMKGGQYEDWGEEEDMGSGRSYARNRNRMGQFTSGHYPMPYYTGAGYSNMGGSGRRYYDGNRGGYSGNRYYDGEKENAINDLQRMMEASNDPEVRMHIQDAINNLKAR